MRFTIKKSCGNERIGVLSNFQSNTQAILETPTSALFTRGGSVVHLTIDILNKVFTAPQLLWIPLANCYQLENGTKALGQGISKFTGLPMHVTCMSFNDVNEQTPPGHFEGDTIPLWTRNGKQRVTANRFMDLTEVFKPDLALTVADSCTSLNETHKRIMKSVDRTRYLFEKCVDRYKTSNALKNTGLIGVIVGASRPKELENCLKFILKEKDHLSGVALSGLCDSMEDPRKIHEEILEPIFKRVSESLPKDILKIVEGCWNPAVVMAAIEHGWDVFDGSYPAKLTTNGHVLALSFDGTSDEECILHLSDKRYKEDFRPILSNCHCLACTKHTRAYIHHLLNTREMLAEVLLSIHNLHHFDEMFKMARKHIALDGFNNFKKHITDQYKQYRLNNPIVEPKPEVVPSDSNKKPRMQNGG